MYVIHSWFIKYFWLGDYKGNERELDIEGSLNLNAIGRAMVCWLHLCVASMINVWIK